MSLELGAADINKLYLGTTEINKLYLGSTEVYSAGGGGGGGFVPTDITGLQLWLDADDSSTITIDTGVSVWADKSGNGNDATQVTGAEQPSLITSAKNGRDIIRADGTDDALYYPNLGLDGTTNSTIFIVYKVAANTGFEALLGFGTGSHYIYTQTVGGENLRSNGLGAFSNGFLMSDNYRNWEQTTLRTDGTTAEAWNDSVSVNSEAQSSNTWTTGVDAYSIFDVPDNSIDCPTDFAELIIYNTALSTSERGQVETYLQDRWGL